MAEYKHGAYGNLSDSVVESMVTVSTVPVYFGTAPVNLVRGYAEADIVNAPVRLTSLSDARARMGDSSDWEAFTLCEAIAAHYNTTAEAVGPIYFVNVLDPDKHRAKKETVEVIGLVNGTASFATDRAILDTITIAAEGAGDGAQPYAEGADYTLAYNHNAGKVVITAKEGGAMADGNIAVSFFEVTPRTSSDTPPTTASTSASTRCSCCIRSSSSSRTCSPRRVGPTTRRCTRASSRWRRRSTATGTRSW